MWLVWMVRALILVCLFEKPSHHAQRTHLVCKALLTQGWLRPGNSGDQFSSKIPNKFLHNKTMQLMDRVVTTKGQRSGVLWTAPRYCRWHGYRYCVNELWQALNLRIYLYIESFCSWISYIKIWSSQKYEFSSKLNSPSSVWGVTSTLFFTFFINLKILISQTEADIVIMGWSKLIPKVNKI